MKWYLDEGSSLQLALKHRQSKNHKMRIVAFVGSPVEVEEKEIVKVAKRLKKEKVNIDIINFGETVRRERERDPHFLMFL